MDRYASVRRTGWPTAGDFATAGARSARVLNEEMPDDVRLIRSYVLDEGGGAVRTIRIYEATSLEAIREYASRVGLPAAAITPIAETAFVRPDLASVNRERTSGR